MRGILVVGFGILLHRHCGSSGGVGERVSEEGTGSDPDPDILQMP